MKLEKLRDKTRHPIYLALEEDAEIRLQLAQCQMLATGYYLRKESDEPITLTILHQEIMQLALYQLNQWMLENRKISLKDYLKSKADHHKRVLSELAILIPDH